MSKAGKPKHSIPLKYVTEFGPLNPTKESDDKACVQKFKDAYEAGKAFKVVYKEATLVSGSYDPAKFKVKDDKIKKSKLITWYFLVTERDQTAQEWIRFFKNATG